MLYHQCCPLLALNIPAGLNCGLLLIQTSFYFFNILISIFSFGLPYHLHLTLAFACLNSLVSFCLWLHRIFQNFKTQFNQNQNHKSIVSFCYLFFYFGNQAIDGCSTFDTSFIFIESEKLEDSLIFINLSQHQLKFCLFLILCLAHQVNQYRLLAFQLYLRTFYSLYTLFISFFLFNFSCLLFQSLCLHHS